MIRTIIADDEAFAREGIRVHVRDSLDVQVVGEAADGHSAVRLIRKLTPDLVFLDVQMPGLDGIEVIERICVEFLPAVIFVTAYDQYAVKAFEAHAVDYLLKPISGKRLAEALQRVRDSLAREDALRQAHHRINELLRSRESGRGDDTPESHPSGCVTRFVVKDGSRFLLLKSDDVDWIEASANYAQLHSRKQSFFVRITMSELEGALGPDRFARIHRSTIVNIDRVQEIKPSPAGDFDVVLDDRTVLRMSRNYRARLLQAPGTNKSHL